MIGPNSSFAAVEHYDYDPLGRLVRVIDGQNRVTEYVYDAAGNILGVKTGGSAADKAPKMSEITPTSIRRGETKAFTVTGQNLSLGDLAVSDPGMNISAVTRTATQISFTLSIAQTVPLGSQKISLSSSAGPAEIAVLVNPLLPALTVEPSPLAIPPDNTARNFTVRLSHADGIPHEISLVSTNTAVATIGATLLTIPAGQTSVQTTIAGKTAGSAVLNVTAATLAPLAIPVYVTGEFKGLSTSLAQPLGVVLQAPSTSVNVNSAIAGRPVGVAYGAYLYNTAPSTVMRGTQASLFISGAGIPADATVSLRPAEGVTVGTASVSADGKLLTVPVSVAADAAPTLRDIIVSGGGKVMSWTSAESSRLLVTRSLPELDSIAPFFGTEGQTIAMTLRGRNLHDATRIAFAPASGITAEAPTVNAEGTEMTARIAIAFGAPVGSRMVTVTTPAGTSGSISTSANTFDVVNEIKQAYTPIASNVLGVVVGSSSQTNGSASNTVAQPVGIVVGSGAVAVTPKVGLIGQSLTLAIQGAGLSGVTAVSVSPSTGLMLGAVSVQPDGSSVTVPVTVAMDAPQTLRTLSVFAGAQQISFATPDAAIFQVSAPAPQLESVTPNVAQIGQTTVIKVRGKDLQGAAAVRLEPSNGVSFGGVEVNAAGNELTVGMTVAANVPTGTRALVVTTAGGDSALAVTPANGITLATNVGPAVTPVLSPAVGIQIGSDTGTSVASTTVSPPLGIVVQPNQDHATVASSIVSSSVGIVFGSAATSASPSGIVRGTTDTLVISGDGLAGITGIATLPQSGITLGAPAVQADGRQVTVPITVAAGAATGAYRLSLTAGETEIEFTDAHVNQVQVGLGAVIFNSISPINAQPGDALTLTVRGTNLKTATGVVAEPAADITFASTGPEWSTDALGEKLTIQFYVTPDAPIGGRVIRVVSPGAISDATATSANTLTVIAPQ